ncbi:MAG: thiamine-phosphate kinase [Planctomycetaceae bacterium]|nr:thiamine-phosphate kinase [Planctomycetaceae bacterium]
MELEFVEQLRKRARVNRHVLLGIGDDAAVLDATGGDTVLTVDVLTEGVDFLLETTSPQLIGRKAIAVNLSDLAAMAAEPVAVLVGVVLPKQNAKLLAEQIFDGMMPLLEKYDVALIGGDTNTWDGGLVLSVTAIGKTTKNGLLRRDGAKPGDRILVTGTLGGSILQRQFLFEPRIRESLLLNERFAIHAAIDISDGLSLDLARLAGESRLGTIINVVDVPVSEDAARLAKQEQLAAQEQTEKSPVPRTPLEHALYDGEDFELVLAVPPAEAERLMNMQPLDVPLTDIGKFVAEQGQWLRSPDGTCQKITPDGFQHE